MVAVHQWLDSLEDWERLGTDIVLFGAVCGVLWRWPGKAVRGRWEAYRKREAYMDQVINEVIPGLVTTHDRLDDKFDTVIAELTPNHGTSLKDAVNRIEKTVTYNQQVLHAWWMGNPIAMMETDAESNVIWVNKAMVELTGKTETELLGKGHYSLPSQEDYDWTVARAEEALENSLPFSFNYHLWNGKFVNIDAQPLRVSGMKPSERLGYLATFKEVKEKEQA